MVLGPNLAYRSPRQPVGLYTICFTQSTTIRPQPPASIMKGGSCGGHGNQTFYNYAMVAVPVLPMTSLTHVLWLDFKSPVRNPRPQGISRKLELRHVPQKSKEYRVLSGSGTGATLVNGRRPPSLSKFSLQLSSGGPLNETESRG